MTPKACSVQDAPRRRSTFSLARLPTARVPFHLLPDSQNGRGVPTLGRVGAPRQASRPESFWHRGRRPIHRIHPAFCRSSHDAQTESPQAEQNAAPNRPEPFRFGSRWLCRESQSFGPVGELIVRQKQFVDLLSCDCHCQFRAPAVITFWVFDGRSLYDAFVYQDAFELALRDFRRTRRWSTTALVLLGFDA